MKELNLLYMWLNTKEGHLVEKICGHCYWYNSIRRTLDKPDKAEPHMILEDLELLHNRYKFITQYDAKKSKRRYPKDIGQHINDDFFDHVELYQSQDNKHLYIITSPYTARVNSHPECIQPGFSIIKPFYDFQATTYLSIRTK